MIRAYDRYSMLPREAEIANLEHEIGALREKLASIDYWWRWGRPYVAIMTAVAVCVGIAIIVLGAIRGDISSLAIALASTALVILLAYTYASGAPRDFGGGAMFAYISTPSHYTFLEQAIAEREKRLAELRTGS